MNAMRWRALLWLVLAAALGTLAALQFSGRMPVQTNLLALLPATERNPLAEEAVGRLTDAAGKRAIFLIGHRSPDTAAQAARQFAADLRQGGAFSQVTADIPPFDARLLTGLYLPHRFSLLTDSDRQSLQEGRFDPAERLQRKLYAPFRSGLSLSPADDPFALTDNWLAELPLRNLRLEPENGLLVARDDEKTWVMVAAELAGSAYDSTLQRRVTDALSAAQAHLHTAYPEVELLRTGTVFYAGAARDSAEREMDRIGAGSLIGMLLLLYLVFRSLRPLALGLLSVGFGIGAAVVVTVAVHGELHLIALVFGASLIGEAIDYAIQYFAAHLGAGTQWEPMAGLRRIAPGLTVALGTSLLGYGALLLVPFPALSQIALFALVGLSAAWLTVFLLLPCFLTRPSRRDPVAAVAGPQRLLSFWQRTVSRRQCRLAATLLLLVALPGWLQLSGKDDVQLLIARPAGLQAQEEKIRALTGFSNSSQFFLVEGRTAEDVLRHEEALAARLARLSAAGALSGFQGVSSFVPSARRQDENRALLESHVFADRPAVEKLLAEAGLRDELAVRLLDDFTASAATRLSIDAWLKSPLAAPFRHLWLGSTAAGFAAVVQPLGVRDVALLEQAAAGLPGITLVDKAGSVTRLFREYRQWGSLGLLAAVLLVFGVLCLRYGARQAAVVLCPTLLAMGLTLATFGYREEPLTLFNLMGLMLVLGVGVNYSIFLREGGVRAAATLAGVLLSAGTTLLSFGLLAFSSMPALAGFGLTLLLGIALSVLLSPMVLTFGKDQAT